MDTIEAKNMYFFNAIHEIGGTESFLYYLVSKYNDRDIVIVYRYGEKIQLERLARFCRVIKFQGQRIKCEKAFFNYNISIIDHVVADEYNVILHGDYNDRVERGQLKRDRLPIHAKITRYIGVSKLACESFEKLTGYKAELCYNPINLEVQPRRLHLLSATRLTAEKGKSRMLKLAKLLDANNIDFTWTVYTNDKDEIPHPKIHYHEPTLDISHEFKYTDYLVQLSDNEGYCYSIVEALMCGTPVICTPCPVFGELGLVNGKNCYYCDFDMKNVPITEIYNNIPKFDYAPPQDRWGDFIAEGESEYTKSLVYDVKITKSYYDLELYRKVEPGEIIRTTKERAEKMKNAKVGRILTKKP